MPGTVGREIVDIFVHDNIGGLLDHQIVDHGHNITKYKKYKMEYGIGHIDKCRIFVGIPQKICVFCVGSSLLFGNSMPTNNTKIWSMNPLSTIRNCIL